ncbi:hypothetical protein Fmac_006121 [Flemingia macrophylla]|uniref:Cyclin-dependent kinase inhibitor n=1 Tax=Flemingia macrophylla TaxID=520843 RepID=A0ABD1NA82_9FABA
MRTRECKRCALMEEASSSKPTISKKRKTTTATNSASIFELRLRSSDSHRWFPDAITVSTEASVSSAATVVSGEVFSDRSCFSSTSVKELRSTALLDLQTKDLETLDSHSSHSTNCDFNSFSPLKEFSEDSEESTKLLSEAVSERRKEKTPPKAEIEEFFTMAEKYEQKRFEEKYNFDIVSDLPLEGRYQWVRLH